MRTPTWKRKHLDTVIATAVKLILFSAGPVRLVLEEDLRNELPFIMSRISRAPVINPVRQLSSGISSPETLPAGEFERTNVHSPEKRFRFYYFDIRCRGELARFILGAAGVDYEDIRVNLASWPALKDDTPFKTLPVLDFNGVQLGQSMAIARYLATEFGLRGRTPYEQALADSVAEAADDVLASHLEFMFEERSSKKENMKRVFMESTLPDFLLYLDQFQKVYSEEYGYIVGSKLTYADLAVYSLLEQLMSATIIDMNYFSYYKYPTELRKRIMSNGKLMRYINNRPRTDF
ncbi:hypothetical protein RvY_13928 [Ramazzottius varieornatus]|uniref:Glutathione transferase n=1 Tax=Ramazzottius varieornatus TaxID=947166 RepID=A0A1D1VY33_RAMVA|nr:hypothetical protein RvY_13928 [Ramazzottius varieornatus]